MMINHKKLTFDELPSGCWLSIAYRYWKRLYIFFYTELSLPASYDYLFVPIGFKLWGDYPHFLTTPLYSSWKQKGCDFTAGQSHYLPSTEISPKRVVKYVNYISINSPLPFSSMQALPLHWSQSQRSPVRSFLVLSLHLQPLSNLNGQQRRDPISKGSMMNAIAKTLDR